MLIFLTVAVSAQFAISKDIEICKCVDKSIEISKEAVLVPSIRMLDSPSVVYYEKENKILNLDIPHKNLTETLDGKGDLDAKEESFFDEGDYFIVEIAPDNIFVVFREKSGDRYMVSRGIEIKEIVFQKNDFKYFSMRALPSNLVKIMEKLINE